MNEGDFSGAVFPAPSYTVFDKLLCSDWYDGITNGAVVCSPTGKTFKLDILAWDARQKQRMFVLSPFEAQRFEDIVRLLSRDAGIPTWPQWYPQWPSATPENEMLRADIEANFKSTGRPEYLVASEDRFQTIYGIKPLQEIARPLLLPDLSGLPSQEDFEYWKSYMGL